MALIGTLRNKMGKVLVVVLALVMIAFVGGEFFNQLGLGGQQDQDIAEIGGTAISNTRFQNKVDELSYTFALNYGQNPLQEQLDGIRNQAWNALVQEEAYEPQFEALGLAVTNDELVDMVQGANISPQIKQFFGNPETGEFDKSNVTGFLASLQDAQPQQRNSWIAFERSLVPSRKIEKYNNLLAKTNYVTKYEAKKEYESQNANASIEYVFVPFTSVPDSTVSASEKELTAYIKANASEYQRDETRSMEYVTFDIKPSAADSAVVQEEIAELRDAILSAANDSTFVAINSDDPYSFISYNDENLPDSLVGQSVGYVSEAAIVNGSYEFYKLSRKDMVKPDSAVYRVARIQKDISQYVSDETINEAYRKADLFSASAGNVEEFRKLAKEQGLTILNGNRIGKNAQRIGRMADARTLVLWLYNDGEKGAVSDVKEVGDQYVVAAMTDVQEEGLANLADVRNQVERKVKHEKKAAIVKEKLDGLSGDSMESLAAEYGAEAKTGNVDFQLFSNNISGIGYAPEAIGLSFALEEEEATKSFQVQDGVVLIKLTGKDMPESLDEYSAYTAQLSTQRLGPNALVAAFPLSYFNIFVSRKIDETVKEFSAVEDMRYKFF
ncbi:MAG: SurA N-terminal domain-containing protein [Bacteroidota bacterium]